MKKVLIIIILFVSVMTQAQREIKIDLLDALALKTVEVSYEHYLSTKSSIGLSALFNFDNSTSDFKYNEDRMITPYFRHYFTENRSWNYFGEVFLGINFGEDLVTINNVTTEESYTDGALGVAVGSKYISKGGFVVDIYAGAGRNLFSDNSPAVVPRVGLNLG